MFSKTIQYSKINLIISEYSKSEIYSDKIYLRYYFNIFHPVELLLLSIFIPSKIKENKQKLNDENKNSYVVCKKEKKIYKEQ